MADGKVTPIRPDMKPRKRKRDRDEWLRKTIDEFQFRLARAVALARAMGVAFQDQSVQIHGGEIDAMGGMLGLAELLDGIRADMVDITD